MVVELLFLLSWGSSLFGIGNLYHENSLEIGRGEQKRKADVGHLSITHDDSTHVAKSSRSLMAIRRTVFKRLGRENLGAPGLDRRVSDCLVC